jgi:endoglucanase
VHKILRAGIALATAGVTAASVGVGAAAASPHSASPSHALSHSARFYTPPPPPGSVQQIVGLLKQHDFRDASLLAQMVATPQAVWFDGGTPAQVERAVRTTVQRANAWHTVPVLVSYNLPFRDCGQYSAGGALDTASYEAWISAFAKGIGDGRAVVMVEPDSLGIIPYNTALNGSAEWCRPDLSATGLTPAQANAARYTQLNFAVDTLEAQPNTSVYLDGTHSAWLGVGDISQRLVKAGVQRAQGFFLNLSNYQFTPNLDEYGTWISDCIAYATDVSPGAYGDCPDQYWNGGPPNWTGVALSAFGQWSDTATEPDLNTSGENTRYANMLGGVTPMTHFVVDTSRNGNGPNSMTAYGAAPYNQPAGVVATLQAGNWCNPPGAGLGLRPTADTDVPLLDAYLWVKTPGQSDGQCDSGGGARAWDFSQYTQPGWPTTASAQALFDPLWGTVDPAAGDWFAQQALQLAQLANPPLR